MYIIANSYLRFCKSKRKPYWNTTSGFKFQFGNLVVINTPFAETKKLLLFTRPIPLENYVCEIPSIRISVCISASNFMWIWQPAV